MPQPMLVSLIDQLGAEYTSDSRALHLEKIFHEKPRKRGDNSCEIQ
jgi:hypothetical protein